MTRIQTVIAIAIATVCGSVAAQTKPAGTPAQSKPAGTITEAELKASAKQPQGATVDVRRVGQGNQSTRDRPAPRDPRVHSPSTRQTVVPTFPTKPTPTPSPTPEPTQKPVKVPGKQ